MQCAERVFVDEGAPADACTFLMQQHQGLGVRYAATMPQDVLNACVGCPPIAYPHFHREASLGRHPAPEEDAIDLVEVHSPCPAAANRA